MREQKAAPRESFFHHEELRHQEDESPSAYWRHIIGPLLETEKGALFFDYERRKQFEAKGESALDGFEASGKPGSMETMLTATEYAATQLEKKPCLELLKEFNRKSTKHMPIASCTDYAVNSHNWTPIHPYTTTVQGVRYLLGNMHADKNPHTIYFEQSNLPESRTTFGINGLALRSLAADRYAGHTELLLAKCHQIILELLRHEMTDISPLLSEAQTTASTRSGFKSRNCLLLFSIGVRYSFGPMEPGGEPVLRRRKSRKKPKQLRRKFDSYLHKYFTNYHDAIAESHSDEDRLMAIATLICNLEWFHPFINGNTRSISMLLLNTLLLQNKLPPCILDDPNIRCEPEEMKQRIKKGLENFAEFYTKHREQHLEKHMAALLEEPREEPREERRETRRMTTATLIKQPNPKSKVERRPNPQTPRMHGG